MPAKKTVKKQAEQKTYEEMTEFELLKELRRFSKLADEARGMLNNCIATCQTIDRIIEEKHS